ncbi:unnamed protein product, partial [Ectocarpus sp. 8 AP-2014]
MRQLTGSKEKTGIVVLEPVGRGCWLRHEVAIVCRFFRSASTRRQLAVDAPLLLRCCWLVSEERKEARTKGWVRADGLLVSATPTHVRPAMILDELFWGSLESVKRGNRGICCSRRGTKGKV